MKFGLNRTTTFQNLTGVQKKSTRTAQKTLSNQQRGELKKAMNALAKLVKKDGDGDFGRQCSNLSNLISGINTGGGETFSTEEKQALQKDLMNLVGKEKRDKSNPEELKKFMQIEKAINDGFSTVKDASGNVSSGDNNKFKGIGKEAAGIRASGNKKFNPKQKTHNARGRHTKVRLLRQEKKSAIMAVCMSVCKWASGNS
ncbi:MAG: hypothetical protein ACON35_05345 [Candidatus Marinamargulisbacteria bacterium]